MEHRTFFLPRSVQDYLATRPYIVAVTGHRDLRTPEAQHFVQAAFGDLLQQLSQSHPEGMVSLSGLAEGADTLFAEESLRLNIPLEGVIAYAGLIEDFAPGPARERYVRLRAQSRMLHMLPYTERSVEAYTALGYRLVDSCDLLIAAWNGLPSIDAGGTGGVVEYALRCGRQVIHIDTGRYAISSLPTL